jgi:hypothetical protein
VEGKTSLTARTLRASLPPFNKLLRVWPEAGEKGNGAARNEASMHNGLMSNQHVAAALKANGYHYRFAFD